MWSLRYVLGAGRQLRRTEDAQKILSCIYRTGQMFGVAYVVDVLRGKSNERIRRNGHDELSTFGLGAAHDVSYWRSVIRQLVAKGLVSVDVDGYGSLRLTQACRPVLRGEEKVSLREDIRPTRRATVSKVSGPKVPQDVGDEALWQALRAKRREIAQAQGVPPYVFYDATLVEMAHSDRERWMTWDWSQVGRKKLARYGRALGRSLPTDMRRLWIEPSFLSCFRPAGASSQGSLFGNIVAMFDSSAVSQGTLSGEERQD